MFEKLVGIEKLNLLPWAKEELKKYAKEVILYEDIPKDDEEILNRISEADGVLVSYTTKISGDVIKKSKNLKYIGMCCSLYSKESASVDITVAEEENVIVTGVRDYGDEGVVEFVVSELISLFHGFNGRMWGSEPRELTGAKIGIIGLGVSGKIVARGLKFFGADVYYHSRTRKPECEKEGMKYRELHDLLRECEVICTCLTKNTTLLYEEEFEILGSKKILINTGGDPSFDKKAFEKFIEGDNYFICDMVSCLNDEKLLKHKNVRCIGVASGVTTQAKERLSEKALDNIKNTLSTLGLE